MIQYTLKCSDGHRFDSWFQSADAFDTLKARGLISCTTCGSTEVEKAIMAPRVQSGRKAEAAKREGAAREAAENTADIAPQPTQSAPAVTPPPNLRSAGSDQERAMKQAMAEMKRQIEENSEYVGDTFAEEARAMHLGDAPERAIHGEANLKEAKELIDDGVPVVPLPFAPKRKTN